jgi:hypothetical protein
MKFWSILFIFEVISMNGSETTKVIQNLLSSADMKKIIDRSKSVDDLIEEARGEWAYDVFGRRPSAAYASNGIIDPTNLDMVSMMAALADRNAVINIPEYQPRRAMTSKEGEWVVSDKNRHGKLVGLGANKKVFSFFARILDQNVINTENNEVGAYRNFLLTDLNGNLYKGLDCIQIVPNAKENEFILDSGIAIGDKIYFKNFVTPQLWSSFYSGNYAKLKALETRLDDEAKYYRKSASELKECIKFLDDYEGPFAYWNDQIVERGESIPVKVDAFEVKMDVPLQGAYKPVQFSKQGYSIANRRAKELTYSILPRLRFSSRAVELAFKRYGRDGENNPGWIIPEIESEYVIPGKRTEWNRLELGNGYSIRFRRYEKTERVNPDSV